MAKETPQASGVKDLIARIRDDGVEAGRRKADRIMDEARNGREAAGFEPKGDGLLDVD